MSGNDFATTLVGCGRSVRYGEGVEKIDSGVKLRLPKADTATVTGGLLADLPIADLTMEDPPIDEVIEQVFSQTG